MSSSMLTSAPQAHRGRQRVRTLVGGAVLTLLLLTTMPMAPADAGVISSCARKARLFLVDNHPNIRESTFKIVDEGISLAGHADISQLPTESIYIPSPIDDKSDCVATPIFTDGEITGYWCLDRRLLQETTPELPPAFWQPSIKPSLVDWPGLVPQPEQESPWYEDIWNSLWDLLS